MSKLEEIIAEYYKTNFDESDIQEVVYSEHSIKSHTNIAIVWALLKGADLVGKKNELQAILNGEKLEKVFDL